MMNFTLPPPNYDSVVQRRLVRRVYEASRVRIRAGWGEQVTVPRHF